MWCKSESLLTRLGISRTPLREAMHKLEGERVLERKSNNRLFVRLITVQEIMETLHVRRLLEADAASRAAGQIPRERLAGLRSRIQDIMRLDDPASPEHQTLDGELHGLILEYCDNRLLASMAAELRRKTRMFSLKRMERRAQPTCLEHLAIIDALESSNAQASAKAVSTHIDNIRKSIVDKLLG